MVHTTSRRVNFNTTDYTDTGANTDQWGDFRTGTAEKYTAFQVQLDKTQHQRSVQLH